MTKNNRAAGGAPGGVSRRFLVDRASGIPYDQPPGGRFPPCFPLYPRSSVRRSVVYGRVFTV